jgi:hypothetical protein
MADIVHIRVTKSSLPAAQDFLAYQVTMKDRASPQLQDLPDGYTQGND